MNTIDYVYRFDPKNPSVKSFPSDAEVAKQRLEEGNQMFAAWMESCRTGSFSSSEQPRYIVQCNGVEVGMVRTRRPIAQANALRRGGRLLRCPRAHRNDFRTGL